MLIVLNHSMNKKNGGLFDVATVTHIVPLMTASAHILQVIICSFGSIPLPLHSYGVVYVFYWIESVFYHVKPIMSVTCQHMLISSQRAHLHACCVMFSDSVSLYVLRVFVWMHECMPLLGAMSLFCTSDDHHLSPCSHVGLVITQSTG